MPKLPPPAQKEITRGGWKYIWDDTKERYIPTEGILSERERRAPIGSWVTGISPTPPVNISEAREKLGSIRTGLTVGGSLAGGLFGGGVPGSFIGGNYSASTNALPSTINTSTVTISGDLFSPLIIITA